MKRITALCAALLCAALPCACGAKSSSSKAESSAAVKTGNTDDFNITASQLGDALTGDWISQDQSKSLAVSQDLSFRLSDGSGDSTGIMTLDERSGMLTVRFGDGAAEEKTYIWVDSYKNVSANTWYIDGGKFALGDTTYIRS